MPEARKRPCTNCRRWFRPDPRIGNRQPACGKPECQTSRRRKTQAGWRRRNPDYATGYRIQQREIARVMKLSRLTVRKVLRSNSMSVPEIQRAEKSEPYRQQILDLLISCKGNLVRVHEELTGAERHCRIRR